MGAQRKMGSAQVGRLLTDWMGEVVLGNKWPVKMSRFLAPLCILGASA